MPARFFCPHCHCSIDPGLMETAVNGSIEYRICPECDEAVHVIPLALPVSPKEPRKASDPAGFPLERIPAQMTEICHP